MAEKTKRMKISGRKIRSPKLTRLEKLTKGLLSDPSDVKAKFTIKEVEGKGRGVFLKSSVLRKDSFVLEYEGDIISEAEAQSRERVYAHNSEGCFIMSFSFQGRKWAIDATRKFDSFTRLLNHSRRPNIRFHPPILTDLNGGGPPRIAAYALRDIYKGEEIVIDYGVQDGEISWLKEKKAGFADDVDNDSTSEDDKSDQDFQGGYDMSFTISQGRNVMAVPSSSSSLASMSDHPPLSSSDERGKRCIRECSSSASKSDHPTDRLAFDRELEIQSNQGDRYRKKRKFCTGEWGQTFTRVVPGSDCYLAGYQTIGTPQKIMRFIDCERKKQRSDDGSVICLSSPSEISIGSSSVSSEISQKTTAVAILPTNTAPDSINKVLEWQIPSPSEDNTLSIKIAGVQSLSDNLNVENVTDSALHESNADYVQTSDTPSQRQQNFVDLTSQENLEGNSQNTINLFTKIKPKQQNGQCSEQLATGSSTSSMKQAANEVVAIDSSVSDDDDGNSSLPSLKPISVQEVEPLHETESESSKSINSDNNAASGGQDRDIEVIDSSSDCEIVHTEELSFIKHCHLPARRPVGFSPGTAQLPQVAVIKPFVSPATVPCQDSNENRPSTSSESPEPTPERPNEDGRMTKKDLEHLKSIFDRYFISSKVSDEDIKMTIYRNWDFFKLLIDRGVSVDNIRNTVRTFSSSKS